MRLFKQSILVAITLLIAVGCDSLLDLEPKQQVSSGSAYETSEAVETALIGAYDGLSDDDQYGGSYLYFADLLGQDGDVLWSGTFEQPEEAFNKNFQTDNSFVGAVWTESYETLNRINNVLANLDVLDSDIRDRVEGEAKFIRGTIYFELVRVFGKAWNDGDPASNLGVPLVLTPTDAITEDSFVSRNTVQEVYQQVITDLTEAKSLLPTSNSFFANSYAASAILSRVYRQQGNWTGARDEASRVIEESPYSLVPTYVDAFANSNNTNEDIFAIQVTSQDGANDLNLFYAPSEDGGRGDIDIQQAHLDKYEAGDERLDQFYQDGNGVVRTSKWQNSVDGNISVVRLAEMYLTRAEGNLILGEAEPNGTTTPAEDLNVVRDRVGLGDNLTPTLEDIRDERFLELAFEGHFLHDLKLREGSQTGSGLNWDANELVYPIPQRERDANDNLSQNPGYGDS